MLELYEREATETTNNYRDLRDYLKRENFRYQNEL